MTAWLAEISMPFLCFSDNLMGYAYNSVVVVVVVVVVSVVVIVVVVDNLGIAHKTSSILV